MVSASGFTPSAGLAGVVVFSAVALEFKIKALFGAPSLFSKDPSLSLNASAKDFLEAASLTRSPSGF